MVEFNAFEVANTLGKFSLRPEFRDDIGYRIDRQDWQPDGCMLRCEPLHDPAFVVAPIHYIGG